MDLQLTGKVVVVTGGGRGHGESMSIALADEGAQVVVLDINGENARDVQRRIEERGHTAVGHQIDITQMPRVAEVMRATKEPVDTASDWPESDGFRLDAAASGFAPLPLDPLPFPSVMVASSNDPYCRIDRATVLANAWGSTLVEAGDLGHINGESGHGPWPEGVLRFGSFLSSLSE